MKRAIIVAGLVLGFLQTPNSTAQCLNYAAVSMTVSQEASSTNAFIQVAGRVKHKGDAVGGIVLYGPVHEQPQVQQRMNSLRVLYKDPDGSGTLSRIEASLSYLDPSGHVKNVASVSSDANGSTGVETMQKSFNHKFDFSKNYYWIQAQVHRAYPTLKGRTPLVPELLGVGLCHVIDR